MTEHLIRNHFEKSRDALTRAATDAPLLLETTAIASAVLATLDAGSRVLLIGNGGSAADAQHIAAEIVGRYKRERHAYAALALTTDTSALTSIGNDYGFDQIFARQVAGLGRPGDLLIALSTSGRSPNIIAALKTARLLGIATVGFTGLKGEGMREYCDLLFVAPSDDTPIIQQIHMVAAHAICDEVEANLVSLIP